MQKILFLALFINFVACQPKQQTDLIVFNAKIYTVDSSFAVAEAFAIKDGKFIAVGKSHEILSRFEAKDKIDLNGKSVYPGFIDAHCHFYGYGTNKIKVDLQGTKSFEEVVQRVVEFSKQTPLSLEEGAGVRYWIQGRGWDQNDWEKKEFPAKDTLDKLFPDIAVFLKRIDGHAALANQKALDLAGIAPDTKVDGGLIEIKDGKPTGILVDNAMDLVEKTIPDFTKQEKINALLKAQEDCFAVGLTTVDDAGLDKPVIDLMDSLQKTGLLKMRMYAMAAPSMENLAYYLANGKYKTERMNVRSFKIYADGALGSRGACLLQPYSDKPGHYGFLLNTPEYFREMAKSLFDNDFQMNTHCIGDSAHRLLLTTYGEMLKGKNNRRWRIEHCQVISRGDFSGFSEFSIIPSVQPTHATSDMYWAKDRVGEARVKGAYAYKDLLKSAGMVAAGTDFPVENIYPLHTFFAATVRQDADGFPQGGFQVENALTRQEALRSMTIWAAYANFEEQEKGSIEAGKLADFVVLEKDIMEIPLSEAREVKVIMTFVNGEKVFESKR